MYAVNNAAPSDGISVGNGANEKATKVVKVDGMICDKHRNALGMSTLTDILHIPQGVFNLFSVTKRQQDGWIMGGDKTGIWLTKGGHKVMFDLVIPTPKAVISAMYFWRNSEISNVTQDMSADKISIKEAHEKFGHCDENSTRRTAKELGEELMEGTIQPCATCATGKAKQKNVPITSEHAPTTAGAAIIFLDIATVTATLGKLVTK